MAQVTITINSREYGIACDDGQEAHIVKLSRMLDEKARLLTSAGGHINENMMLAMVGLLLADELEDTRKKLSSFADGKEKNGPHNASVQNAQPQTVVQTIEKIVEPDMTALDHEIAAVLSETARQIEAAAQEIEKI